MLRGNNILVPGVVKADVDVEESLQKSERVRKLFMTAYGKAFDKQLPRRLGSRMRQISEGSIMNNRIQPVEMDDADRG